MTSDTKNPLIQIHEYLAPYVDCDIDSREYAQSLIEIAFFIPEYPEIMRWAARAVEYVLHGVSDLRVIAVLSGSGWEILASQNHLFVARFATQQAAENALQLLREYEKWYKTNKQKPVYHVSFPLLKTHMLVIVAALMYNIQYISIKSNTRLKFRLELGDVTIGFTRRVEILEFLSLPCFNSPQD